MRGDIKLSPATSSYTIGSDRCANTCSAFASPVKAGFYRSAPRNMPLRGSEPKKKSRILRDYFCSPGGIRTPDLRLRRPLLYPTELLNHKTASNELTCIERTSG